MILYAPLPVNRQPFRLFTSRTLALSQRKPTREVSLRPRLPSHPILIARSRKACLRLEQLLQQRDFGRSPGDKVLRYLMCSISTVSRSISICHFITRLGLQLDPGHSRSALAHCNKALSQASQSSHSSCGDKCPIPIERSLLLVSRYLA